MVEPGRTDAEAPPHTVEADVVRESTELSDPAQATAIVAARFRAADARLSPSARPFRLHIVHSGDERFIVDDVALDGALSAHAVVPDVVAAGERRSGEVRLASSGIPADTRSHFLFAVGDNDVRMLDAQLGLVGVRRPVFDAIAERYMHSGERLRPPSADAATPATPEAERLWRFTTQHIHRAAASDAFEHRFMRDELLDLTVRTMLVCFALVGGSAHLPIVESAPGALRRAMAFIDAHVSETVTLADIADAARLSPRSVQALFRRELDQTPFEYVRDRRLDLARELLTAAGPDDTLVRTVAHRAGFTHLGRFASLYRSRFGESPSATLER